MHGLKDPTKNWRNEYISWLFRNQLPFLIGVVNKDSISINIYQTTGMWFVFHQHPDCSQIELIPRNSQTDNRVDRHIDIKLEDWPEGKGNGYRYKVDLGNPLVALTYRDIQNPDSLKNKKAILRKVIELEQYNIRYRDLGIKHFQLVSNIETDNLNIGVGSMYYGSYQQDLNGQILDALKGGLVSLAINLASQGKTTELKLLEPILKLLPSEDIYKQLKEQIPQAFEWVS